MMNFNPFYFDIQHIVSPEWCFVHDKVGYYLEAMIPFCSMKNIYYEEETLGAVYITSNFQGIYVPVYYVGPEYIWENSCCINNREEILKQIRKQKARYDF